MKAVEFPAMMNYLHLPSFEVIFKNHIKEGIICLDAVEGSVPMKCLLYGNEENELDGILIYFLKDLPNIAIKGDIYLIVDKNKRRQGIATQLVRHAETLWTIDWGAQCFTNDGHTWFKKYQQKYLDISK